MYIVQKYNYHLTIWAYNWQVWDYTGLGYTRYNARDVGKEYLGYALIKAVIIFYLLIFFLSVAISFFLCLRCLDVWWRTRCFATRCSYVYRFVFSLTLEHHSELYCPRCLCIIGIKVNLMVYLSWQKFVFAFVLPKDHIFLLC